MRHPAGKETLLQQSQRFSFDDPLLTAAEKLSYETNAPVVSFCSTNPVFPEFTPSYAGSPTDSQEEPIATAGARFLQAGCPSSYTTDNIKTV